MAIYTKADYSRGVTLRHRSTRQPIPLTGWALEMVIKDRRADVAPLLTLSTANGQLTLDPDNVGRFIIAMNANETTAIGAGDKVFAIYRVDGGQRTRVLSGRLVVREGI